MKNLRQTRFRIVMAIFPLIFFFQYHIACAQKAPITFETYKTWSEVTNGGISDDGNYTYYTVENQPIGSNTTVVESINKKWRKELINCQDFNFSSDNKYLICKAQNDTIITITLGTSKIYKRGNSSSYRLLKTPKEDKIIVLDIPNEKLSIGKIGFEGNVTVTQVTFYQINITNNQILIKQKNKADNREKIALLNITNGNLHQIYEGQNIKKIIYDQNNIHIALLDQTDKGSLILCYNINDNKIDTILNDSNEEMKINSTRFQFSSDGEQILITLTNSQEDQKFKSNPEIWNYKDSYLKSYYYNPNINVSEKNYLSTIRLKSKVVTYLIKPNQKIISSTFNPKTNNFFIYESNFGRNEETFIPSSKLTYSICFTNTGKSIELEKDKQLAIKNIYVSPTGNYIIYFDPNSKSYYSYNVHSGKKRDLTGKLNESFLRYDKMTYPRPQNFSTGEICWLANDKGVIVNGNFDLWLLDPTGKVEPKNITEGKGERNKIVFNIAINIKDPIDIRKGILLTGIDTQSKDFGFYSVTISGSKNLNKLWSGQYYVSNLENKYFKMSDADLIKAKTASRYIVKMEAANDAPNFYITEDFKSFRILSKLEPQKKYNWLSSELLKYTGENGIQYQGILYKPENFDSTRKYPVLFIYYKEFSFLLNKFCSVDLVGANFSIPYAVSNGYIVYQLDIVSKIGKPGDGALQSVLEAQKYLAKNKWIDIDNIGIAGHSFGGFETNYIITHTTKFKAAVSGSGMSDLIGQAYSLWDDLGHNKTYYYQYSDPQMDIPITEDPQRYAENSPILFVKNVKTPLLLMHNTEDNSVPFLQSRQFFLTLRSLKQPVWWINYSGEKHTIMNLDNKLDYNRKVFEFLNFYLKNNEEPKWMMDHL